MVRAIRLVLSADATEPPAPIHLPLDAVRVGSVGAFDNARSRGIPWLQEKGGGTKKRRRGLGREVSECKGRCRPAGQWECRCAVQSERGEKTGFSLHVGVALRSRGGGA